MPPESPDRVLIFDTTLRDGEQSPGISLNATEKLEIAHQLARLGVDIIEAGFPISSPGDFEAGQAIAREVPRPGICGLARADAQAGAAVAQARAHCDDVGFRPMDARRADLEFTAEVLQIALDEGATTINVP